MEMITQMYLTLVCTPIPAAVLSKAGSMDKLLTGPKTLHQISDSELRARAKSELQPEPALHWR